MCLRALQLRALVSFLTSQGPDESEYSLARKQGLSLLNTQSSAYSCYDPYLGIAVIILLSVSRSLVSIVGPGCLAAPDPNLFHLFTPRSGSQYILGECGLPAPTSVGQPPRSGSQMDILQDRASELRN
ncbi:hypothetical protein Tco_1300555 [Tanacetum coccineum]